MRKLYQSERGLLSLGACISVTIFIFLMLYMYSFFVVFEARNAIGHAVLATANSLSLDAYANNATGQYDEVNQFLQKLFGISTNRVSDFSDNRTWYTGSTVTSNDGSTQLSGDFASAIETRFCAYLGGDSRQAEAVLERYHIQGGLEGLDFSGSYTDSEDLHLTVRYTIEYEFQVFGFDGLQMEQSVCSKLWK